MVDQLFKAGDGGEAGGGHLGPALSPQSSSDCVGIAESFIDRLLQRCESTAQYLRPGLPSNL